MCGQRYPPREVEHGETLARSVSAICTRTFRDGVDHFAGWLWKFGKQDHDIRKWLRNNPRGQEVAHEFNIDVSRDAMAG